MTSGTRQPNPRGLPTLAGPRYRPAAFDLLALAKDAIHGHAMIAEKVKEHAELAALERQAAAERRAAESAAESPGRPAG